LAVETPRESELDEALELKARPPFPNPIDGGKPASKPTSPPRRET